MKISISKVVEQSISYEITDKYRTKSASFYLKDRVKLTYPAVASAAHAVSTGSRCEHCQIAWCLKYSVENCKNCIVNFSDVGTARCSRAVSLR